VAKKQQIPKADQPKQQTVQPNKQPQPASKPAAKVSQYNWYVIILMAVAFAVNARTIGYEYTYDDAVFTSKGNLIDIRGMGGLAAIPELFTHGKNYCFDKSNNGSYRPLLPATFAIEHSVFGFNPAVSHFINLVLFCVLIMLLYNLLRRMFNNYSPYIPFLILLLFELHPVHTEVMASVKSRDEILALLFTTLSMLQTFKYIDNANMKHLLLSGLYFFIALLAKESPACFVAIAPLTLYFFTKTDVKKIAIATVPYFLMIGAFVVIRALVLEKGAGDVSITENTLVAATNFSDKLGTILIIQLKYLQLLIFPHPLSFDYSYNQVPITHATNPMALISLVVLAAMFIYAVVNFKRKDIYAYSILFYFFAMGVTSGLLLQIGATMAERFLFIGSLAFCIVVVFLLAKLFKTDLGTSTYENSRNLSYVIIVVAVLYSVKSMARNEDWRSNLDLFKSGVITAPNSWRSQNCLAVEYKRLAGIETNPQVQSEYNTEAIKYYYNSIAIYPDKADSHADLGAIYFMQKNYDSAIVQLKKALQLNPKLANANANLGTVYLTLQQYHNALGYYRTTIEVDPTNIIAQFNLGVCYYQEQKNDSALIAFKKSIAIQPEYYNHKAFDDIVIIYTAMGKMDSAARYQMLAKQYK